MSFPPVVNRLVQLWFGGPIIRNDLRGELVEQMVAMELEPEWESCSGDWGACDLIRPADGLRIQVKQSAALQSWTPPGGAKPRPSYSIKSKAYRWEGPIRIEDPGRHADIYIFGWHDRCDEQADHRDPIQWQFFVVAERNLPHQRSLTLSRLMSLADAVPAAGLAGEVRKVSERLQIA